MRVSGAARDSGKTTAAKKPAAGFRAALLAAAGRRGPAIARRPEPAFSSGARLLGARRVAAERDRAELGGRRDAFREEERPLVPAGLQAPCSQPRVPDGVSEIRAAVRAVPAAIEASRVRAGEPLALSFGRSLSVEIRGGAAGVEIRLLPSPRLARAASAELPALVAALRARGIAVARAEVRARPGAASPGARRAR